MPYFTHCPKFFSSSSRKQSINQTWLLSLKININNFFKIHRNQNPSSETFATIITWRVRVRFHSKRISSIPQIFLIITLLVISPTPFTNCIIDMIIYFSWFFFVGSVQVPGLAPGPIQEKKGVDLHWNFGLDEPKKMRPKEQVFLEKKMNCNDGNSKTSSSAGLLQARSVSTGLGLSLENSGLASSGESALLGQLLGDNLALELQRQDAEIDSYIRLQENHLRRAILEKFQSNQLRIISHFEQKVLEKLREKDAEVDTINKNNMELEMKIKHFSLEANAWHQQAKYSENAINALKLNLQQLVNIQGRDSREGCGDSKEGCGDSEVDDSASCCNVDENESMMMCRVCGANRVSMLLLPCKHLCLCRYCESGTSLCPVCGLSKCIGMEVYI